MDRSLLRPARPVALLALGLLLTVACSAGPVVASTPTNSTPPSAGGTQPGVTDPGPGVVVPDPSGTGPDDPIGGNPLGPTPVDPDDQWQTLQRRHDLVDLHAQSWDHVSLSPDGRTLTVYFWGGVQACYGLADVQVTRTAGGVATVTLIAGIPPAMGDMACIDIAAAYKTIVQLDEPLIIDGSGPGLAAPQE